MLNNKQIIGQNIRKHRISRNISIDELAEMLHLSPAFVGLIERGQRGAKLENLIKISNIFDITINDIVYENNKLDKISEKKEKPIDRKKRTLNTMLFDLNEHELEFIISVIKELKKLRNNKNKREEICLEDLDLTFE